MAMSYILYKVSLSEDRKRRLLYNRHIRDRSNPFEVPEEEFLSTYKVSKDIALYLSNEMYVKLGAKRSDGSPCHMKVLICLYFLAHGIVQKSVAGATNNYVAQRTVSKYLDQFCNCMVSRLMKKWIKFPQTDEARQKVAGGFKERYGLPNVLGAVDCTHVKIFPPPMPHKFDYLNEDERYSLNVLLVTDVSGKIISLNAESPGKFDDQQALECSDVNVEMKKLYDQQIGKFFLLGDSEFTLEPWLMTPVKDAPQNNPAERYNRWHRLVHSTVKRTTAYLQGTFKCLDVDRRLHYSPEKSTLIIITCCILYNMMKHYRVPDMELARIAKAESNGSRHKSRNAAAAEARREEIIRLHFTF